MYINNKTRMAAIPNLDDARFASIINHLVLQFFENNYQDSGYVLNITNFAKLFRYNFELWALQQLGTDPSVLTEYKTRSDLKLWLLPQILETDDKVLIKYKSKVIQMRNSVDPSKYARYNARHNSVSSNANKIQSGMGKYIKGHRDDLKKVINAVGQRYGMDLEEKDVSGKLINVFSARKGIPDGILDYLQASSRYTLRKDPWNDLS